jgi:hypothetical protein
MKGRWWSGDTTGPSTQRKSVKSSVEVFSPGLWKGLKYLSPTRRPPPGSAAAHLSPLLDREPVAAQDGPGHRAIAVLTLAFAVTRLVPREDPRARRAMTENGFYVIYAPVRWAGHCSFDGTVRARVRRPGGVDGARRGTGG